MRCKRYQKTIFSVNNFENYYQRICKDGAYMRKFLDFHIGGRILYDGHLGGRRPRCSVCVGAGRSYQYELSSTHTLLTRFASPREHNVGRCFASTIFLPLILSVTFLFRNRCHVYFAASISSRFFMIPFESLAHCFKNMLNDFTLNFFSKKIFFSPYAIFAWL